LTALRAAAAVTLPEMAITVGGNSLHDARRPRVDETSQTQKHMLRAEDTLSALEDREAGRAEGSFLAPIIRGH
jgi:hypothetical protein